MDCESVDIYPVGWAELVGHKLEGPRLAMPAKKEKKLPKKGGRGKKRSHNPSNNSSNGGLSPGSALSQVSYIFFRQKDVKNYYHIFILLIVEWRQQQQNQEKGNQ